MTLIYVPAFKPGSSGRFSIWGMILNILETENECFS